MRRLKEDPLAPGHPQLLQLTSPQRLFVQRWMELFDWSSDIHFQTRPISLVEAQAELHEKDCVGVHRKLLNAEIAELEAAKKQPFSYDLVETDPILAAERLAASPHAARHHPLYLFHGIRILLGSNESFENRVAKLALSWASSPSEYRLYFRLTRPGRDPADRKNSPLKRLPWLELPEHLRALAAEWPFQRAAEPSTELEPETKQFFVVQITATARDSNAALENAVRTYHDYRACVQASSPGWRGISVDLSTALIERVDTPNQARTVSVQPRRFLMRGGRNFELLKELEAATEASSLFAAFVRNFASASERLRNGDVVSAFEALVLSQDLAFYGCDHHSSWRYPRYLVELGSMLVALDWPRRYYDYIEVYCRTPSHTVDPDPQVADRVLSRALVRPRSGWPLIVDDGKWAKIISRSDWDELLKRRREDFTALLKNLAAELGRRQRIAAWDLARAVRDRNFFVHRGSYLRHHRSIGILLDAYELVLLLRIMGFKRTPTDPQRGFNGLAVEVERDFADLIEGRYTRQTARSLCEDGWSRMWSRPAVPAAERGPLSLP